MNRDFRKTFFSNISQNDKDDKDDGREVTLPWRWAKLFAKKTVMVVALAVYAPR